MNVSISHNGSYCCIGSDPGIWIRFESAVYVYGKAAVGEDNDE